MQEIKKEREPCLGKKKDPVDKRYLAFEYGVEEGLAFRLKARFSWV